VKQKTLLLTRKEEELKEKDNVHSKQTMKLQNELDTSIANLSMKKRRLEEVEGEGMKVSDLLQKVGELKAQLEVRKIAKAEEHEKMEKRFAEMTRIANELQDQISVKEVTISNLRRKETDLELSNQKLREKKMSQKSLSVSKMAWMEKIVVSQTFEKDAKRSQLDQVKNESEICKEKANCVESVESERRDSSVRDVGTSETLIVEEEAVQSTSKTNSSKELGVVGTETTQNLHVEENEETIDGSSEFSKEEMENNEDTKAELAVAKTSDKLESIATFSMMVGKEKDPVQTSG